MLSELQVNLDSMNINVPALPAIGMVNQPCNLQKCTSYTYCGLREKHAEYFSEMNQLKAAIKKKRDNIKAHQEQLTSLKNFVSQSEHQVLKALTPRMIKVDPSYKLNKQKLLRDIHILRKFYNGKIPAETTNDAERLRISLHKCKQTLEHEVGEVAVQGIQQYERFHCDNENNAINLNVPMSVLPENNNNNVNNNVIDVGGVSSSNKIDKQKKSGKHENSSSITSERVRKAIRNVLVRPIRKANVREIIRSSHKFTLDLDVLRTKCNTTAVL